MKMRNFLERWLNNLADLGQTQKCKDQNLALEHCLEYSKTSNATRQII
jgi:hypothetical protein